MSRSLSVMVVLVAVGVGMLMGGCPGRRAQPPISGPMPHPSGTPGTPPPVTGRAPTSTLGYMYVCPAHADQKSVKPGKCPTCGAYMKADTTASVEYYCPKDSGVVKGEPGACDKCGAALVARPAGVPAASGEPKTTAPGAPGEAPKSGPPTPAGAGAKTGV